MQNITTEKKHTEQLNIQSPADTKDKGSSPLLTRDQIPGTPFWIIGTDELGYHITYGKYRFNEIKMQTQQDCIDWYEDNMWNIIIHLIAIGIGINNIDQKNGTPDINNPTPNPTE